MRRAAGHNFLRLRVAGSPDSATSPACPVSCTLRYASSSSCCESSGSFLRLGKACNIRTNSSLSDHAQRFSSAISNELIQQLAHVSFTISGSHLDRWT